MKRKSLVLLALVMTALFICACGNNANNSNDSNSGGNTATPSSTTASETPATVSDNDVSADSTPTEERVVLTIGQNNTTYDTDKSWWPSEVHTWLEDKLNATMEFKSYDQDQTNLALASGDLPDLFVHNKAQVILEGGFAVALDDYLDQYGQNIVQHTTRNDFIRKYMSNGDGKLYFHTPNSGYEDLTAGTELWQGYIVRWDLYKEIGAPPINSDDDYINALKQMYAAYPQTESGLPVYAMGVHNDWGLWGWMIRGVANGGYNQMGGWNYYTSTKDNSAEIFDMYTNDSSPFYDSMRFYNKLYREGLLDPDSFIMGSDELGDKAKNRQYLGGYCMWFLGLNDEERKSDPESIVGFTPIAGEGLNGWYGQNAHVGWGDRLLFINAKSKNIEKCVEFINLMDDPDVLRTSYSGIQGVHWDYVDGVPKLFDSTIALRAAGGEAWSATGIGNTWGHFVGVSGFGTHPDGYFYTLWDDVEIKKASLSPLQKDVSDFYQVDYPAQKMYQMAQEGKSYNQSKSLHTTVSAALAAVPEDIQRINSTLDDIAMRAVPQMVAAGSDADFEAAKEQLKADVLNAGSADAWAWWESQWNDARAFVKSITN